MQVRTRWVAAFALAFGLANGWVAAEDNGIQLTARLVAASMTGGPETAEALADVLPLFQENLKFSAYRLVCKRTFRVSDGLRVKLESDIALVLGESRKNQCTVQVERRGKALLTSRFRFERGHPVVLGGFPEEDGSTLIIVLAPG